MTAEARQGRAQHMQALALANHVRLARVDLARRVCRGELAVEDVLRDPPYYCQKVPVFELVQWVPRVGVARALRIVAGVCSETLPVGVASTFTRERVIARLNEIGRRAG